MSYTMVVIVAVAGLFAAVVVGIVLSFLVDARKSRKRQYPPNFVKARKFACSDYDVDEIIPVCVNFDL